MPKKTPLITVRHLTKSYNEVVVLDDFSFTVPKGELLAIIGPNGAGKSTLLKLLLGLEKPTAGTITIEDKAKRPLHERIGYVPQSFQFDRSLPITVREFLDLVSCGRGKHCNILPVQHVLDNVGMTGFEEKKIGVLSGGQLQRVLIARALLHDRDILILDEPAAGIDSSGQVALYDLLATLVADHGITALVVSHEIDFVTAYATSVLCLNHKLICHDIPKKALSPKTMDTLYGHSMTLHSHLGESNHSHS